MFFLIFYVFAADCLYPDKQHKEQHCLLKFFQCEIYLMLYGAHRQLQLLGYHGIGQSLHTTHLEYLAAAFGHTVERKAHQQQCLFVIQRIVCTLFGRQGCVCVVVRIYPPPIRVACGSGLR